MNGDTCLMKGVVLVKLLAALYDFLGSIVGDHVGGGWGGVGKAL